MPLLFLVNWFFGLFTLGFIILDVYLFHEWYKYKDLYEQDHARHCLIGALALLAFLTLGKFVVRIFTGKTTPEGQEEPKMERSAESTVVSRPDGSKIHVEFEGPVGGTPLIMIHGWGNNCTEWYYQRKQLGKKFRLILIDLPGLGLSEPPKNGHLSLDNYSNDLAEVIKISGSDVVLWGHSIGGMIILNYFKNKSVEANKNIKAIILGHTTFTNPLKTSALNKLLCVLQKPVLEPMLYIHIFLSPYFRIKNWMSYFNGNLHISNAITSFAGTQTRGMVDTASLYTALASPAIVAKGMLAMFKYDVTNSMASIKVPTLILAAAEDLATKPEASSYIHKEIKGSLLVTVTPGGHMSVFERNLEISDSVQRFITGLEKPVHLKVSKNVT